MGGAAERQRHTRDVTGYEVELFGPGGPELRTRHGLVIAGVRPLPSKVRRLPEVVVIAGGSPATPLPEAEKRLVRWLRQHHRRIPTLVSICTGAFILGEAGEYSTVGVRRLIGIFSVNLGTRFPRAKVADEGIFVHDGNLWTSAGITAGIDLTLALVEADHGHAVAMAVAKKLVLFLRRSGSQAQFSSTLRRQERIPSKHHDIHSFILEHLERASVGGTPRRRPPA